MNRIPNSALWAMLLLVLALVGAVAVGRKMTPPCPPPVATDQALQDSLAAMQHRVVAAELVAMEALEREQRARAAADSAAANARTPEQLLHDALEEMGHLSTDSLLRILDR